MSYFYEGSVVVNLYYPKELKEDWVEVIHDIWYGARSRVTLGEVKKL